MREILKTGSTIFKLAAISNFLVTFWYSSPMTERSLYLARLGPTIHSWCGFGQGWRFSGA